MMDSQPQDKSHNPQQTVTQNEQESQTSAHPKYQKTMDNYIKIGEITRKTKVRKKRKAQKRSSTAKLTKYGYGFKVITTLTRLNTRNVHQINPPIPMHCPRQLPSLQRQALSPVRHQIHQPNQQRQILQFPTRF